MHILSAKSKCINRSTSREREREREKRERCVLFEFRHFLTLTTRLRINIFAKNSDQVTVLYIINGICADGEQAKAIWFSEGRTKVQRFIGSPRSNNL